MLREYIIDVTQDDIDHGIVRDCEACPVATAAYRILKVWLEVSESRLHFGPSSYVRLPESAIRFIEDFDDGYPVFPFSFPLTLDLPESV